VASNDDLDAAELIARIDNDIPSIVGQTVAVEHYSANADIRWPMTIHVVSVG
jgi:hypothetical protein